ncbi:MAG: hypothetical protein C0453_05255 [Comamonadaceae bacterium]|nr:hypothetical protein [Comamonadaceae bacterium]
MPFFRFFSILLTAIGLLGCATVDKAAVQAAADGKSLAIVTTVDSTLQLSWIGTTVFNNESSKLDRPEWGLASLALRDAEAALSNGKRFNSVKSLDIGVSTKEEALRHPEAQAVDLIVVISPSVGGDFVAMNEVPLRGVGVRQRSALGLPPYSAAYASLEAGLFEAKTGKQVALVSETSLKMIADKALGKAALDKGAVLKPELEPLVQSEVKMTVSAAVKTLIQRLGLGLE